MGRRVGEGEGNHEVTATRSQLSSIKICIAQDPKLIGIPLVAVVLYSPGWPRTLSFPASVPTSLPLPTQSTWIILYM